MKLRTLLIVAVILAILTSVGYYIRNASLTTPEDDPLIGTQIVDPNILKAVTKIHITKEGEEAILEQNDQGKWVVKSLYGLPIDFGKLNRMIRSMVDSKVLRRITSRENRLARLDLTQGTVKFLSDEGKELVNLTYGKSLSGGGKAFIFGYEKTAFLSSENPSIDANSNNWADKVLYKFEADNVAGIQFVLSDETWGVRRDDKDKDFVSTLPVDARTPKQSDIKSLINRFTSLRFTEVGERETESATEAWKLAVDNERSLKFTLFSGETISVKMNQWAPLDPEGEEAPATTESPVAYLHISISQPDHAINGLMDRLIFKASSYTFTSIPLEITEVADLLEPEEEPEEGTSPAEIGSDEQEDSPASATTKTIQGQPEIKQHDDGNSVIFEANPPKKEEAVENAEEAEAATKSP
tara:strand:- start:2491 stop:3726 length:1236 start_codon:yes stop_codon:yes gene_type:complete